MADVTKDLSDAVAAIDNLTAIMGRLAQSDDQLVKWAVGSTNRTGMELHASKGRFDYVLKMRKPAAPTPPEPAPKK
jgi:hypothetical protein